MRKTTRTDLCQLHQLLRRRHHALWFDLINETVGDVGVSIIEELANDELVQVLPVLQSWFRTIHAGSGSAVDSDNLMGCNKRFI